MYKEKLLSAKGQRVLSKLQKLVAHYHDKKFMENGKKGMGVNTGASNLCYFFDKVQGM